MMSENNMMTEVLYQLMMWTKRRKNQSRAAKMTTESNIYDINTEAGISHAQEKTDSNMAADQYNADP